MKTDVLIIGGGFGGAKLAQFLHQEGIGSLLVDAKDYFEVTFATLRNVTAPEKTGNRARKHYKDFLKSEFLQGRVTDLTEQQATLEDGTIIDFKQAVIASGSSYSKLPMAKTVTSISLTDRNAEMAREHQALKAANTVLIIGGGIVGVELAGEVAHAHPDKGVILAHNTQTLLDPFKPKAQTMAAKQLQDLGVKIEYGRKYQQTEDGILDANTGTTIDADLVYNCTGTEPNNNFLKPHLNHILNAQGLVNVDSNLRVVGANNLYALGDIADVGEGKLGYLAGSQAQYLAKQMAAELKGKNHKGYKRNPMMALIPTGQKTGVVQMPFMVTSLGMLVNMKQKDLFISKIYGELG